MRWNCEYTQFWDTQRDGGSYCTIEPDVDRVNSDIVLHSRAWGSHATPTNLKLEVISFVSRDDNLVRLSVPFMFSSLSSSHYHNVACICRQPITSIEWCPYEASMLSTTSADGQLCCWDLAVERDPEEEMLMADKNNANVPSDIPPQLLFVHGGQSDVKEVTPLSISVA